MDKQAYLSLYAEAEEVFRQYENPCDIKSLPDGSIQCQRGISPVKGVAYCCRGCEHATPTGCSIKSLGCKLYWCYSGDTKTKPDLADGTNRPIYTQITRLRQKAIENNIPLTIRRANRAVIRGQK